QIVLILCGLVASGKSTFALQLQQHYSQFLRCNQDDLGNRHRVEQHAREALLNGMSVCIDRTNFNPLQRSYWIEIAREFPGTLIWVIVFDTPFEASTSHPTIKTAEQGLFVLSRFASDFVYPQQDEGFHRIIYLPPSDQRPIYSRSNVSTILKRVWGSVPITP
ncbi:hypothetical protein AMATHDRAFT_127702, partial [Amanita thiersii Skay4041]